MSFEFNPTAVESVNQESIEDSGLRFPGIIFFGGDMTKRPKKNQPDPGISWRGGFFISKENLPNEDLSQCGWTEDSFISQSSGKEVEGWYKPSITIMHIARRRHWRVGEAKTAQYFAWPNWKEAKATGLHMSGRMQSIVIVQGLEHLGPLCLSLAGHAQMSFCGESGYEQSGALALHRRIVVQKANEVTKEKTPKGVAAKKWDHYAFWLTVGAATDANGDPKFTEVGTKAKSSIVLPVPIGIPATPAEVNLNDWYVGPALLAEAANILAMLAAEGWKEAWANNSSAESTEQKAPVKATVEANYAEEAGV